MIVGAVLGELLDAARRHADAAEETAVQCQADLIAVLSGLRRLVTVMARYLDDAVPGDQLALGRSFLAWERDVAEQREYLHAAAGALREVPPTSAESWMVSPETSWQVRGLLRAADVLGAGRELMLSHYGVAPWGGTEARSRWGLALGGEAVALAVVDEMARWARKAADWAGWAAAVSSRRGDQAHGTLAHAQSMLTAAAGVRPERDEGLDVTGRRELLRAIPLYEPPARVPPHEGEGHADLCAGIMASAERLRAQAFIAARHPDPGSGPGWERSARACAIASDLASRAMPMLARQAARMGVPLGAAADAETSATALAGARDTWRALAGCWRVITTDAQDPASPVVADLTDLVVRMGRLVSGDPRWTPAMRQGTSWDAARIAPDEHGLRLALAAIHDAADAIEYVARADLRGVQSAATAGRLYMPARIIGAGLAVGPRRYLAAPQDRAYVLQCAGQAAIDASARAARMLDSLAVRCDAPSRPLAIVRAVVPAEAPGRGLQVRPAVLAAALRELDRPGHAHRQQAKADPQAVIAAYVDGGLTTQQISWVFRITSGRAAAVLREHGIAVGEDRGRGTQRGQRAAGQRVQPPRRAARQAAPEPRR